MAGSFLVCSSFKLTDNGDVSLTFILVGFNNQSEFVLPTLMLRKTPIFLLPFSTLTVRNVSRLAVLSLAALFIRGHAAALSEVKMFLSILSM